MSMLAERKQKQRWSLNPRGKQWTDDSSKFGQKMLEKMGWKHGKGLGANENGITEHVKLSYKNDQKGMGYKETEQWTEHDDNFSRLLSNLNGGSDRDDAFKADSLHKKAETVRTRINYHKFTKGKDLSRYSEKDLANIFGKKTLKPKNKTEIVSDSNEVENEGVLINKGSITDYFKRKMPDFGTLNSSGLRIGNNGVLTMGSESDSERPTFGFSFENAKKWKYEDVTSANETKRSEIVQPDKRKRTFSEDTIKKSPQKRIDEGYEKKKSFSEEHVEKIKKKSNKKTSKEKVESNEESVSTKKKLKNCEGSEEIKVTDKSDFGEDKLRVKKSKKNSLKDPEDDRNIEEASISTDRVIKGRKKPRSKSEHFDEAPKLKILENVDETERTKKIKKSKRKLENVENCGFMNVNEEIDEFNEVLEIKSIFHKDSNVTRENIFFKTPTEELYDNTEDLNGQELIRRKNVNVEEIDQETAKAPKKTRNRKSIEDKEAYEETQKNGNVIPLRNSEEKKIKNKKVKNQGESHEEIKKNTLENEEFKSKRIRNQVGDKSDAEITKKRKMKGDFKRNVEDFEGGIFLRHAEENGSFKRKKTRLGGEEDENAKKSNVEEKRAKSRSSDDEILRLDDKITKKARNRNSEIVEEGFKRKKTKDSVPENPFDDEEIVKIDEVISKKLRKSINADDDENYKRKSKSKKLKTHEETVDEKVQPIFNIKGKVKKIAEMIDFNKTKAPSISNKKEEKNKEANMDINLQISTLKRFTQKLMEVSSKIDDKPMVAGVVNPGFYPLYNKVTVAKHVLNTIEESNEEAAEPIESPDPPRLVIEYENGVHKPIMEKHEGIENPCFEAQGIENPALDISDTDLVLNVVTTPILKCERPVSRSARKNVRFSNRNEERIIPNNGFINNGFFDGDDRSFFEGAAKPDGDRPGGVDNVCFDARSQRLSEKVETMSKGIENCQAELDNDINELRRWKSDDPVGEIGRSTEGHAPVSEGVRLSFRNVRFGKSPHWMSAATTQAKKSYKHLIRGDIIVAFKNSNLHQINGYGAEEPKKPVW